MDRELHDACGCIKCHPEQNTAIGPPERLLMDNALARVETLRETQIVYQVFCEEHRTLARTDDFAVAKNWVSAHNKNFHRWSLGITEDTG